MKHRYAAESTSPRLHRCNSSHVGQSQAETKLCHVFDALMTCAQACTRPSEQTRGEIQTLDEESAKESEARQHVCVSTSPKITSV